MPEPGPPALARGLLASKRCFHGYDDDDEEDGAFPYALGSTDSCPTAVHTKLEEYLKIKLIGRDYCIRFIVWP